jgi:hypothetical protein
MNQENTMQIPDQVDVVSIDELIAELSQRKARHPKAERVLIVGPPDAARLVMDQIAAGVSVTHRLHTVGLWYIETLEGVAIRHVASRSGLRGMSADLVVILNDDRVSDVAFGNAALVVMARRGRVVVL